MNMLARFGLAMSGLALASAAAPVLAADTGIVATSNAVYTRSAPIAFEDGDTLAPGQYRWAPDAAPTGAVEIKVDLARQLAYVYRGGTLIGLSTVSSGKDGHETPVGIFPILQKEAMHHSNLYDSAPMPFMQRLTWDGVALHAGRVPGYPASHGCIRLPRAFAQALFGVTQLGAVVEVSDGGIVEPTLPAPTIASAEDLDREARLGTASGEQ